MLSQSQLLALVGTAEKGGPWGPGEAANAMLALGGKALKRWNCV